ncbi:uncharacterized protein H6S33_009660 [Morchella sextelata]|uniref:uncharacterized protein n=1 Tax=Morchella sextelata TaxID=1174677 RepID=UPI001D0453D7|nr:uncharacterized protein H6S33_009660 [Morchella sextelata]KAH0613280.1 hypothetical protein H6S33_009660 [Morchella sextelata]
MARLNDPPQPGQESLEAIKKRYIRQNREIARVNSTQSTKIRSLETETTRLLTENIDLREQVIKLQAQLDRRERGKAVIENVEATKRQLEGKVAEMQELLASLGKAITVSPRVKPQPKQKAHIVSPDQTTYRRGLSFSFSEAMRTEDNLPAISEDSRRSSLNVEEPRRTSLGSEDRRSSLNFEEIITLLPPRADDAESDEDLKPPTSSMLEIRSKRRRDSTRPTEVEATKSTASSRNQLMVDTPSEKPKKRRFEDRDQAQDIETPLSLDFKFTRHPQRAADVPKIRAEAQKPTVSMSHVNELDHDIPMKEVDEMVEVEKIVETGKRAVKMDIIEKRDPVPIRETVTLGATPAIGRRALGPKSTNSDPFNSPQKHIKTALPKEKDLEKPEKTELPPQKIRTYRDSNTEPPSADVETGGTGRPSRRSKANNVNYALPNLRDKMRREDRPGETGKSEGRTARRMCLLRGKISLAINEPRKPRETGIGGLLDKRSGRDNGEMELPETVMTYRKRRASNLHQGTLMDLENDATSGRLQTTAPTESRRKTVSFDPESTHGGEEGQSRNRESASSRRRSGTHSNLASSSSQVELAGDEVVRSSRRTSLGNSTKGVRSAKSTNNMGDETEFDNNHPVMATGTSSRRRSMML